MQTVAAQPFCEVFLHLGDVIVVHRRSAQHLVPAGDLIGAGAFRANIALIYALRGNFDRAWSLADQALEELRGSDMIEYGKALCKHGKIAHLAERPEAGAEALNEAESVAKSRGATGDSELGQAIGRLKALMEEQTHAE